MSEQTESALADVLREQVGQITARHRQHAREMAVLVRAIRGRWPVARAAHMAGVSCSAWRSWEAGRNIPQGRGLAGLQLVARLREREMC